jgi:chaperonin GroES
MTIKPVGNRLLVKPITAEEKTKSGIVLPDTIDKEKKTEGEILALGQGEDLAKLNLAIGQKIIFGKYAGDEIKKDHEEYKILNHEDVLAVIE